MGTILSVASNVSRPIAIYRNRVNDSYSKTGHRIKIEPNDDQQWFCLANKWFLLNSNDK